MIVAASVQFETKSERWLIHLNPDNDLFLNLTKHFYLSNLTK